MPLRHRLTKLIVAGTCSIAAAATVAGAAEAAPGFVTQNINMRAGPDVGYPLVASLPEGTQVEIYGCLPGWTWCDTQVGGARGWVAGVGLQVLYDQQPEPLTGYGEAIGLPFIGFDFDNYWGSYYRGRPWFSREDRWHGHDGRGPGFDRGPDRGPGFDRGPDHGPGRPGPWQGGPVHGGPNPGFPGGQGGYRGPGPGGGGPGEVHGPGGGPGGPGQGRPMQGPGPGGPPHGNPGGGPGGGPAGGPNGGRGGGPGGPPGGERHGPPGGGEHRGPGDGRPN